MSGGRWDYQQHTMTDLLDDVAMDEEVVKRWPKSAAAFERLSTTLGTIFHDMDWCLSGDTTIDDDEAFDMKCRIAIAAALHPAEAEHKENIRCQTDADMAAIRERRRMELEKREPSSVSIGITTDTKL